MSVIQGELIVGCRLHQDFSVIRVIPGEWTGDFYSRQELPMILAVQEERIARCNSYQDLSAIPVVLKVRAGD